ncbi:hypothetical protein WL21_04570 [Burkholderia ubonensis]|nr:hypothetical protein WL20_23325 [Burkholderia ubonensis]KVZ72977.1 hypothetical protein WL21_04570 [Burkholderia ubonensis]
MPGVKNAPPVEDIYVDELYEAMQRQWEADPSVDVNALVQTIRDFVASDGTRPFRNVKTHTMAFAGIMQRLIDDGGRDLPVYQQLYDAQVYSLVGAGVMDQFITAMIVREEPEPW